MNEAFALGFVKAAKDGADGDFRTVDNAILGSVLGGLLGLMSKPGARTDLQNAAARNWGLGGAIVGGLGSALLNKLKDSWFPAEALKAWAEADEKLEREQAALSQKAASAKIPFETLRGAKTLGSMARKMPILSQIRLRQQLMGNLMAQVTATPEGTRYALNAIGRGGKR